MYTPRSYGDFGLPPTPLLLLLLLLVISPVALDGEPPDETYLFPGEAPAFPERIPCSLSSPLYPTNPRSLESSSMPSTMSMSTPARAASRRALTWTGRDSFDYGIALDARPDLLVSSDADDAAIDARPDGL